MHQQWLWPFVVLTWVLSNSSVLPADEPVKPAAGGPVTVVDSGGKEHKLLSWKFVSGTRTVSWAAGQKPIEVLEFRETASTNYVKGILTLIPLESIRSIDYDNEKQSVALRVAGASPEADQVLAGITRFVSTNRVTIQGMEDLGEGKTAPIKLLSGPPKGIRGIRFPSPRVPLPPTPGRAARVTDQDKVKTVHPVTDLQPLYRQADGSLRLAPVLSFRKTVKVDVARVEKLRFTGLQSKEWTECGLKVRDRDELLLKLVHGDDKLGTLDGFVSRVAMGWKFFPLHTMTEVRFDDMSPAPAPR